MASTPSGVSRATVRDALALVAIAAGFLASALSWAGICADACAEAHRYRLFGVPLPPFGAAYFTVCGLAFLARRRVRGAGLAAAVLLAGGLGSEFVFLWIQKFVIGRWCPWCVVIAVSVAAACALFAGERLQDVSARTRDGERTDVMKRLAPGTLAVIVAFAAGIAVSAVGMKKPDAFAAGFSPRSLAFGDEKSNTEVYVVTDWFCPSCRVAEPEIVKGARLAMRRAKVFFVDYPIHPETLNFIPYHLSFMVREKDRYLPIREALAALALKTKEPTPEDVQAAVAALGVKYVPLNYTDVLVGTQFFNSTIQRLKVPGTPSVVVRDAATGRTKTLTGSVALTADGIAKALAEVSLK